MGFRCDILILIDKVLGLFALFTSLLAPDNAIADIETPYPFSELTTLSATAPLWRQEQEVNTASSSEIIISTSTAVRIEDDSYLRCSCISYARKVSEYSPPVVKQAIDIPVISTTPKIGGWILFRAGKVYSKYGHAGIVVSFDDNTVTILERNYRRCQITKRTVDRRDVLIRGYYY